MGRFYGSFGQTVYRDELFGGNDGNPVALRNVEVDSDATITRGMILAADATLGKYHLATAADKDKVLVVARDNFVADSDNYVTTAYASGKFNRERLTLAEGANIADFVEPLRKVDIILTSIRDLYGKKKY